jgi:hypothetical protein
VVERCCREASADGRVAVPANLNAPDQTVISGDPEAVTAAGDEFTTRLLVYTSLPGVKQGDMLLIGATAERDPYQAGAHEVRAVTEFGDTFSTDGPPDFRIAT